MKKLALLIAIAIASTGCSHIELAHKSLECRGYPDIPPSAVMTRAEEDSIPDAPWRKMGERLIQLRERIETICKDIEAHNEAYDE